MKISLCLPYAKAEIDRGVLFDWCRAADAGPFESLSCGERINGPGKRGIPADVAWYAYACAQCGYCVDECDQYYGRGWESQTPRGKWYYLRQYMQGKEKSGKEKVE